MGGFLHTVDDTIVDLRRNLTDRYKDCYAVLKELLQNADDAGATELSIAWYREFPGATHPLLKGPVLFIVNNAPFTHRDSYAIHLAGTGSKGHEAEKIGKFGLGLKSVFHLCEAFFYISDTQGDDARVEDEELKKFGRTGILNPWHPARYAAWDRFCSEDQSLLRRAAHALLGPDATSWFGLCLPLRQEKHCKCAEDDNPADWAIEPSYYGDSAGERPPTPPEDLFSPKRIASINAMLPLMSNLQRVRFWQVETTQKATVAPIADIRRQESQHVNWRTMKPGEGEIAGRIEVHQAASSDEMRYAGAHVLLRHDALADLMKLPDWPMIDAQTDHGRRRRPAAVKQHAAVVIIERPGEGVLRIDRAVFLPLGDPPHRECSGTGTWDFELILHGYFFVDAGRQGVDFAPEDAEPRARQKWNQILHDEGTLPLIVPALAAYARAIDDTQDSTAKLHALTELVRKSPLFEMKQAQMCRNRNWMFRLRPKGSTWCAVETDLPIVRLPGGRETKPELPFAVFPALRQQADAHALTLQTWPCLSATASHEWPSGLTAKILRSTPVIDVAKNDEWLEYVYEVGRLVRDRNQEDDVAELQNLVRRFLQSSTMSELRKRKGILKRLIQLLPPDRLLSIPFKLDLVRESERVFERLVALATDVLPVPEIFLDTRPVDNPALTTRDTELLLTAIADIQPSGAQEEAFRALVAQTVSIILSSWEREGRTVLEAFGDLPLFYVRNYALDQRVPMSARELDAKRLSKALFVRNASLCRKMQACLAEDEVVFLAQREVEQTLIDALGPIPSCDAVGCATLLGRRPRLTADVRHRSELLRSMLAATTDNHESHLYAAMWYLLHGNPDAPDQTCVLYVDNDNAWGAMVRSVFRARGETWRLISPLLANDISRSHADRLNLSVCDAKSVVDLLREGVLDALVCEEFADRPVWRKQLVNEWPEDSKELLKRLPIFLRSDGGLTSITNQTFIQGKLAAPPASVFPDRILIIDEAGAIAKRQLARTLAPKDVLAAVLDLKECHLHWQYILDIFPRQLSDGLEKRLAKSPWIPCRNELTVSPLNVVCDDRLKDHVRRLNGAGGSLVHKADLPADLLRHPRWQLIQDLCPQGEALHRVIGDALSGNPLYAVGRETIEESTLAEWIEVFSHDEGSVMPTAQLCRALQDDNPTTEQSLARHLLPSVKTTLDAARTKDVLSYLSTRHQGLAGSDRTKILELFNRYLREGMSESGFAGCLGDLELLSQATRWCPATQLALSGHNVAASNLLHRAHQQVFVEAGFGTTVDEHAGSQRDDCVILGIGIDKESLAQSSRILGEYLEQWRSDEIPDDALAAVVAVLGDNEGYPERYERLSDARPLGALREMFSWHNAGPGHWGLADLMEKQHICILPADANTVEATNLLGRRFDAAVSKRITSLFDGFDGRTYRPMHGDERCHLIRLRQVDPEGLSTTEKLEVLRTSIEAIRSLIHGQSDDTLAKVWSQITEVGQLDIEIAQDMILESSAMLLETQLSIRHSEKLKSVFSKWHKVRQRAKTAEQAGSDSEQKGAAQEKVRILDDLRRLLVDDEPTQRLLVDDIRRRLVWQR